MLDSPVISVIVPIYQAEKYMRRCLDSIRAQTFSDFEAILVEDGSSDASGQICDEYAEQDSRFRVIHKEHEGVSIARQTGLDSAKGKYVIHADCDDWVEPEWLQSLYDKIEADNADMVFCDFERVFVNRSEPSVQRPSSMDNTDILADLLVDRLMGVCWNKLIRTECFRRFNISFVPNMSFMEDLFVVCMLLVNGIKVSYLPKILYHYDLSTNTSSLTRNNNYKDHIISYFYFIDSLSPVLSSNKYGAGWFYRKSKVKELIFRTLDGEYDIYNTYKEINSRYIQESRATRCRSLQRYVALCLRAPSKHLCTCAHLLYRINVVVARWKQRLKLLLIIQE